MIRSLILGATVFVDYASRWVKLYLMLDETGDSAMGAKNAFERDCMTRNVLPKHYHADNGRFAENSFKEDCVRKMQNLTFCGVGDHHILAGSSNSEMICHLAYPVFLEKLIAACGGTNHPLSQPAAFLEVQKLTSQVSELVQIRSSRFNQVLFLSRKVK